VRRFLIWLVIGCVIFAAGGVTVTLFRGEAKLPNPSSAPPGAAEPAAPVSPTMKVAIAAATAETAITQSLADPDHLAAAVQTYVTDPKTRLNLLKELSGASGKVGGTEVLASRARVTKPDETHAKVELLTLGYAYGATSSDNSQLAASRSLNIDTVLMELVNGSWSYVGLDSHSLTKPEELVSFIKDSFPLGVNYGVPS
jgi:hypothetical protein